VSRIAPMMVTVSQFCSLSTILFYTYQMQLIYERLKKPKNKSCEKEPLVASTATFGNKEIELEDMIT
jgi:hypothetical protein